VSISENKAVITSFVEEVLNQGKLGQADQLVISSFVELDPFPGQTPGREGLKAVIAVFRSAFPDMHWVIEEMIGEEDKVASRLTWTGTHRGEFMGIPPTGKRVTVTAMVIDRLAGGKMADSRILMDTISLMRQLGAIPEAAPRQQS
jgi:steroid delta-isomerase-like uncharacterized protein